MRTGSVPLLPLPSPPIARRRPRARRYDRDLFVNILWDNMVSEEEFQEQNEGDLTGVYAARLGASNAGERVQHLRMGVRAGRET